MKDFMLIFMSQSYESQGLSPDEMQARMGKWFTWQQKMAADGVVKNGNALHEQRRHISGPDRVVSDLAATGVKELVGGYYVVTARDLEHASEIAQGYPDYDLGGTVEIREVMVFDN